MFRSESAQLAMSHMVGAYLEAREIRTPNLLIWSQTRCRCAIAPLTAIAFSDHQRLQQSHLMTLASMAKSLVFKTWTFAGSADHIV